MIDLNSLDQEFERKVLLFWINTLPVPSCLLVSYVDDLKDGAVFFDLILHLKQQLLLEHNEDAYTQLNPKEYVVGTLLLTFSKLLLVADELINIVPNHFPGILEIENEQHHDTLTTLIRDDTYCERIALGEEQAIFDLLQLFKFLFEQLPNPKHHSQHTKSISNGHINATRNELTKTQKTNNTQHEQSKKEPQLEFSSLTTLSAIQTSPSKRLYSNSKPPKHPKNVEVPPWNSSIALPSSSNPPPLGEILAVPSPPPRQVPVKKHQTEEPPKPKVEEASPPIPILEVPEAVPSLPSKVEEAVEKKESHTDPNPNVQSVPIPESVNLLLTQAGLLKSMKQQLGLNDETALSQTQLASLFNDGTLLCRLVEHCEKTKLKGVVNPKSNAASLANVNRAFQVLRNKQHMNEQFLWFADGVVSGNEEIIIGILNDMVKAYKIKPTPKPKAKVAPKTPTAKTPSKPVVAREKQTSAQKPQPAKIPASADAEPQPEEQTSPPKTLADLLFPPKPPKKLPQEVLVEDVPVVMEESPDPAAAWIPLCISWLNSFGLSESFLQEEMEVVLQMRSGILLCDVVSALEQKRILGIFRPPRTRSTSLSNIIKALTLLRANHSVRSPYLNSENEICDGDKQVIFGILYDIYWGYHQQKHAPHVPKLQQKNSVNDKDLIFPSPAKKEPSKTPKTKKVASKPSTPLLPDVYMDPAPIDEVLNDEWNESYEKYLSGPPQEEYEQPLSHLLNHQEPVEDYRIQDLMEGTYRFYPEEGEYVDNDKNMEWGVAQEVFSPQLRIYETDSHQVRKQKTLDILAALGIS